MSSESGNRPERVLGALRVLVGPLERVFDPGVLDHQPADLLDLVGAERGLPEQGLDAVAIRGAGPLDRGDERQRALALLQVGPDRLAEPRLVRDEVERVVADLERDADVEPVAGQALDLLGVGTRPGGRRSGSTPT